MVEVEGDEDDCLVGYLSLKKQRWKCLENMLDILARDQRDRGRAT